MMKKQALGSAIALCTGLMLPATAAPLNYSESVDGELSDVFGTPTPLTLDVGVNVIAGTIGEPGSGATNGATALPLDADFFWFALGAGQSIDSIVFSRSGPSSDTQSFAGYRNDNRFLALTNDFIDRFTLFSDGEAFSTIVPLEAGNHAFWLQETGGVYDYSVTLNVVPEPAGVLTLCGLGIAALARRRSNW